ncbi:MAG: RIP metalloprotease RseP, partial [Bacteroidota bacterium]
MSYIIYFVITIAILVFVHEFGHFIAAKLSGMRVDAFAIGFGKRLFGWNKLTGLTFGDLPQDFDGQGNTDYRLCLLPLGGYVKIAGMVDESMDVKFAEHEPEPYEFRAKSTPKKLFVITAGVLMNLILAFLIFWGTNYSNPKQYIKTTTVGYVSEKSPFAVAGLSAGDKIISVNNKKVHFWEDVHSQLFINNLGDNLRIRLIRNDKDTTIVVPAAKSVQKDTKVLAVMPAGFTSSIDSVVSGTPAEKAGVKKGDVLYELKGQKLANRELATSIISSNKGKELPLKVIRDKDTVLLHVTPSSAGLIGVIIRDEFKGDVELRNLSAFEAMTTGFSDIGRMTKLFFTTISSVIKGKVEFGTAFGGPVKIAQYAAKSADTGAGSFLMFLGMLSLSLAIINILPFPVLDGGHFVIILIEGIIRREIPLKAKIAIQNAGFVILLLFMAFIIYNDLISL